MMKQRENPLLPCFALPSRLVKLSVLFLYPVEPQRGEANGIAQSPVFPSSLEASSPSHPWGHQQLPKSLLWVKLLKDLKILKNEFSPIHPLFPHTQ